MIREKTNIENGEQSFPFRVRRGGGWGNVARLNRVVRRYRRKASGRNNFLSFRLIFQTKEKNE